MKKNTKPYSQMTTRELAEATAEFDKEFIIDSCRPMTPAERAQWEKARRKPGRPRTGRGAKVISVSVERDLLKQTDRLARRLGVTRAGLISRSLRAALLTAGQE
jgi:hypothetical protein